MPITETIISVTKGATAVVGLVTILPVAGPVGTITAGAATAASLTGAILGFVEHSSKP